MGNISFEYGFMFWFIAVFIVCHIVCPIRTKALYYAHVAVFAQDKTPRNIAQEILKWLAIVALFTALASPYKSQHIDITPKQGYDIALLLDGSMSMQARGFNALSYNSTRFDAVKDIVTNFIDNRIDDNMGVVMFGEFAFIAAPLTYDKKILKDIVKRLEIGMAGKNTAIYDALGQGVRLLKKGQAKSKIAILLTDGRNTALNVSLQDVLKLAKKYNIKIYTIGIGMAHEIDTPLLATIAQKTNAKMFQATNAQSLASIYQEIDALEKSEIKTKTFEDKTLLYHYALLVSLMSLVLYILLRFKRGAL